MYDILYGGTKEEILKVRCPDCGNALRFEFSQYDDGDTSFTVWCDGCNIREKGNNGPKPNCVEFFGNEYTIK